MPKRAKIVIGSVAVVAIAAASSVGLVRLSLERHIAGGINDLLGAGAAAESLTATAGEYYSTEPPAFLWTAKVRMASGVSVIGHDRYVDGRGSLEMRLLGAIPVASDDGPEMDEGTCCATSTRSCGSPAA